MTLEQQFRDMLAKDQAMVEMAQGAAIAALLETLPQAEAEGDNWGGTVRT